MKRNTIKNAIKQGRKSNLPALIAVITINQNPETGTASAKQASLITS